MQLETAAAGAPTPEQIACVLIRFLPLLPYILVQLDENGFITLDCTIVQPIRIICTHTCMLVFLDNKLSEITPFQPSVEVIDDLADSDANETDNVLYAESLTIRTWFDNAVTSVLPSTSLDQAPGPHCQ